MRAIAIILALATSVGLALVNMGTLPIFLNMGTLPIFLIDEVTCGC